MVSFSRFVEMSFDHSLNSTNIKNSHHFGQPCNSNHSCIDCIFEEEIKRECCREVNNHPTTFEIS